MYSRFIVILVLLLSCSILGFGQTQPEKTVADELKQLSDQSSKEIPQNVLEAGKAGIEELIASGVTKKALNVGDKMPAFKLLDANGKSINSSDLLKKGHLVITFYRGEWCPFCNLYLRSLQKNLPKFKSLGANLVAISVEPPYRSLSVAKTNDLGYTVLSDPQLRVSRLFAIVYEMPKVTNNVVLKLGFDIAKYNGMEKAELPLSATYVVSKKGEIVYAFLDPDYKHRAEHTAVIKALTDLQTKSKRKGY